MDEPVSLPTEAADSEHHDHEGGVMVELVTLRDWLRYAVTRFNRAGLFFGHGTDNAWDEAVYLLTYTLCLPAERLEVFLDACIETEERPALMAIIERRVRERIPAAYLTHEAWLGDYRFYVDQRVIVPRSYFAALLEEGLSPWLQDPDAVTEALDLCTGSGCLAILMAHVFPNAHVTASDVCPDALDVARRNVMDYGLEDRITLVQGDLFQALEGQYFDVIVCNPPYVTDEAMSELPEEYRHEPVKALAAGPEGLDVVHRLLEEARAHLRPEGLLFVEVGHNRPLVEAELEALPMTWMDDSEVEDKVFVIRCEDLPQPKTAG
jgi:ribosomal protein L3 glutamine methyltransferase